MNPTPYRRAKRKFSSLGILPLLFLLLLAGCGTVKKARTGMARLALGGVGQELLATMLCTVPTVLEGKDGSISHLATIPLDQIIGCGSAGEELRRETLEFAPGVVPMDGKGRPKWTAGTRLHLTIASSMPNASAPPRIVRRATRDR